MIRRFSGSAQPAHAGPGFRDWALLGIGLSFVAAGVVLVPRNRDVGVVTVTFFGMCAAAAAATIVRKLRLHRQRPLRAEIAGGVPIRPSRTRVLAGGLAFLFLGTVLVVFGQGYSAAFRGIAWVLASLGAALVLGVVLGFIPAGYLRFDPEGMTVALRGWAFTIPWDRITHLAAGEYHDNPILFVWVDDPASVVSKPPELSAKVLAHLASNERWLGAPVAIMTSQYSLDLPLVLLALQRYVEDPASRRELLAPSRLLDARTDAPRS